MFYRKQFDTIIANKSEHAALTKSAIIHPIKDHHSNRKMYAKKTQKGRFLHEIRITNFLTIKPFFHKKNFKNIHELF